VVSETTGVEHQLGPEEEQVVGTEGQEAREPPDTVLPRLEEPDKRVAPLPARPRAALPPPAQIQEEVARQTLSGWPILAINRYTGTDADWQMLVRWDIPEDYTGDLHEISLLSDDDANTRYRIYISDRIQDVPVDRQISTPVSMPWRGGVIPGPTSVTVEVRSVGSATINVDAFITGTER